MSELKCPACGGIRDDDAYVFTGGTVWCCAVCAFECEDKDIPRISAEQLDAMVKAQEATCQK